MLRKIKIKWILLALIVAFSYSFTFTFNAFTLSIRFPKLWILDGVWTIHSESAHWFGFIILGYIFGPVIFLVGIFDEIFQALFTSRHGSMLDVWRNWLGCGIGLILKRFFYIKIGRLR